MQIAVVGAGIIGASVAYYLARRGIKVRVFEAGAGPASGVTGRAFGWVNLVNGEPVTNYASYRIRREAVGEYRRLMTAMPGGLNGVRLGSLVWHERTVETEALVRDHLVAGARIELVDARTITALEPQLLKVPECAAYSPDDLALDAAVLTRTLLRLAGEAGADVAFGQDVEAVEASGGRAVGLRIAGRSVAADVVVLTAGTAIDPLIAAFGFQLGLERSPAVLLRYAADRAIAGRILCGPDIEIRQTADHSLLSAASYRDDGEQHGPAAIGRRTLEVMRATFASSGGIELREATVGYRPYFADGFPRLGFLPDVGGIYVAVGHPGVILAPLLGRLATEEIVDGQRSPQLVPGFETIPAPRM
jgi:glycine/D-amino acid oxidase-like deaminating enzyme